MSMISVFGSHARGEAGPDSDVDLLVDFTPGAGPTLFSLARLDLTLESALGIKVDVVPVASLNPRLMSRRFARPLLEDMKAFATEALGFLGDRSDENLIQDRMRFLALTRAAEVVGEAASQVAKVVRDVLPNVDFGGAIAMRNRLIHGYGAVGAAILADTIRNDFPRLSAPWMQPSTGFFRTMRFD